MHLLMMFGAGVTLLGLVGLGVCIALGLRARRARLDDGAMRAALRRVVALNMAALGLSALGLMCVVAGALLAPG